MCVPVFIQSNSSSSRSRSSSSVTEYGSGTAAKEGDPAAMANGTLASDKGIAPLFTKNTRAIVWGMQSRAIQGMLDFDYSCSRSKPSVVAMVYPLVYVSAVLELNFSTFPYKYIYCVSY